MEFPKQVLFEALQERSDVRITILWSLARRPTIPFRIVDLTPSWLGNGKSTRLKKATLEMLRGSRAGLPKEIFAAMIARLADGDLDIGRAASDVLKAQTSLSGKILVVVITQLADEDLDVKQATSDVLKAQTSLSSKILAAVVTRLAEEDRDVR